MFAKVEKIVLSSVLVIIFSSLISNAQATYPSEIPLATIDAGVSGSVNSVYNGPSLKFSWGTPFDLDPRFWPDLMDEEMVFGVFTANDIGKTVSLSTGTTEFSLFKTLLTNGFDDDLMLWSFLVWDGTGWEPGWGYRHNESSLLHKSITSPYPDLYGYEITRIDMFLNNLEITERTSTGTWPVQNFTDVSASATYTIYGVPEPSTILLLGIGLAFLKKNYSSNGGS